MAKIGSPRPHNLAAQAILLRTLFPESKVRIVRGQSLTWAGVITPSQMSDEYSVSLSYSHAASPKVFVIQPELQERDGRRPEHLWPDGSLCLYFPRAGEWNHGMLLAKTILPWTSEWLLHYEIWLATGKWCGGGIHPGSKTN